MKPATKVIIILVSALIMGAFAMPQDWKSALPEWGGIRETFTNQQLHLGLDLQGGTQLDYTLDLRQAEKYNSDDDTTNDVNIDQIIEGVRSTLERRVNGLGVSEPNIYTAKVGNEHHVIVELAGVSDIAEAKKIVGKTIQLEFKEQKEKIEENEKELIQASAQKTFEEAKTVQDFSIFGEKLKTADGKVSYDSFTQFQDQLDAKVGDKVWNAKEGDVLGPLDASDGYSINQFQQMVEQTGFGIYKIGKKETVERTKKVPGETFEAVAKEQSASFQDTDVAIDYFPPVIRADIEKLNKDEVSPILELDDKFIAIKLVDKKESSEQIQASHILIAYKDAERSTATRSKEEAKKRAEEVLAKVKNNGDFASLAKEFSDEPNTTTGDLGLFGRGMMTPTFEAAAFDLKIGEISDVVETPFGFHIIKKTAEKPGEATKYTTQKITIAKTDAGAKAKLQALLDRTAEKEVKGMEEQLTFERIFYSTVSDPWQSTGLDGSKFARATVTFDQFGKPLVAIEFNKEGAELFAQLTEKNIGKPIAIFVGGILISAPNVNEKISGGSAQITGQFSIPDAATLAQNLNTGAISAPIVLTGQHQVGATLGAEALNKSIIAGLAGIALLGLYMVLQYRLLGLVANLALGVYSIILIFILKTSQVIGMPIILTLAGIAGLILSIGMAVDANILIFERMKEELKAGKKMSAAIAMGFDRAWLSIRDSNVSSLITCAILAWFGSSIIRGFAINLAIGILVSMFTAITVTRVFLYFFFLNKNK